MMNRREAMAVMGTAAATGLLPSVVKAETNNLVVLKFKDGKLLNFDELVESPTLRTLDKWAGHYSAMALAWLSVETPVFRDVSRGVLVWGKVIADWSFSGGKDPCHNASGFSIECIPDTYIDNTQIVAHRVANSTNEKCDMDAVRKSLVWSAVPSHCILGQKVKNGYQWVDFTKMVSSGAIDRLVKENRDLIVRKCAAAGILVQQQTEWQSKLTPEWNTEYVLADGITHHDLEVAVKPDLSNQIAENKKRLEELIVAESRAKELAERLEKCVV